MVKRKKRNQAHPLTYQLPGPLYSDEGGTLSLSQIEDVFALVDWKIVMLDPEVRKGIYILGSPRVGKEEK